MMPSNERANSLRECERRRRWYNGAMIDAEEQSGQQTLACIVVSHLQ